MGTAVISPYNAIDFEFFNDSGALISAHEVVMIDPTPGGSATKTKQMTIDPFSPYRGPIEGITPVPERMFAILQGDATATAGDAPMLGVSLEDIKDGEWGKVRVWGPTLCKCSETTDDAHLTSYGVSTTAGQLAEITASATVYTCAFQILASGATSAGDKRKVFVTALAPQNSIACPYGIFV